MLTTLREIYRNYDATAQRIRDEAPKFSGLWGIGQDPKNHPAHMEFYSAVEGWVHAFLAKDPDHKAAFEAALIILEAADSRRNAESYWFTYAAQAHAAALIPCMTAQDCLDLADWYDAHYTKLERLPIQKDLYKKLRKAAKKK